MYTTERTASDKIVPAPRTAATAVTIIDQDEVVRLGVLAALHMTTDFVSAGAYASPGDAVPSGGLVLLGIRAGSHRSVVSAIGSLTHSGAKVILHSAEERPVPLRAAITQGAHGVALRRDGIAGLLTTMRATLAGSLAYSSDAAELLCTNREVAARLSAREADVLECMADGLTHRMAARRLGIDEETIKTHLKSVRAKYIALGRTVTNVGSLKREARADGWLN